MQHTTPPVPCSFSFQLVIIVNFARRKREAGGEFENPLFSNGQEERKEFLRDPLLHRPQPFSFRVLLLCCCEMGIRREGKRGGDLVGCLPLQNWHTEGGTNEGQPIP